MNPIQVRCACRAFYSIGELKRRLNSRLLEAIPPERIDELTAKMSEDGITEPIKFGAGGVIIDEQKTAELIIAATKLGMRSLPVVW